MAAAPGRPDARRDLSEEFALERVPASASSPAWSVAICTWLSVDVLVVRALFLVTALSSGLGLMGLYLAGVLLTTDAGTAPLDRVGTNWHRFPAGSWSDGPWASARWRLPFGSGKSIIDIGDKIYSNFSFIAFLNEIHNLYSFPKRESLHNLL